MGSRFRNYGKKTLEIWICFITKLCHRDCHTGTELSRDVTKMEWRVQRTHTKLLRAWNWQKRSARDRDTHFCLNVDLKSTLCVKGLNGTFYQNLSCPTFLTKFWTTTSKAKFQAKDFLCVIPPLKMRRNSKGARYLVRVPMLHVDFWTITQD